MKKILVALIALAPAFAFAAPTGHQICRGLVDGKRIQFVFGTYALAGDAVLTMNGKTMDFDGADFDSDPSGGLVFTANKPGIGSIRWVSSSEGSSRIPLSVDVPGTHFENKILRCRTLDATMGTEVN